MSRDQIIKIGMVILVVVLLCAVIITSTGMFGKIGGYANAELYTSGDTEITEDVKKIDVSWTSGKVTVAYHAENTVSLKDGPSPTTKSFSGGLTAIPCGFSLRNPASAGICRKRN